MLFVIVAALLVSTSDMVNGKYLYRQKIGGSIRTYERFVSWDEAFHHCRSEGAVLASPTTKELQNELQILFGNTSYFIGVDTRFHHGFVSVEGVPLDEMSLEGLIHRVDPDDGECLSMDKHTMRAVQCTARLPYACYKNQTSVGCETDGYKFEASTRSCYKVYEDKVNWTSAHWICAADGGYLAVPNDRDEAQLITKLSNYTGYYMYIGVRDFLGNGSWRSVRGDREENIYHDWRAGSETNDVNHTCAMIDTGNLKMKKNKCDFISKFVCESDSEVH